MYYRYYNEPQRYQAEIQFYEDIENEYPLLIAFEPEDEASEIFDRLDDIIYYIKDCFGLTSIVRYQGPTVNIFTVTE